MLRNTVLTGFNRRHWWHPRASMHLDFVNRRYYWAGRERNEGSNAALEDWLQWTADASLVAGEGLVTTTNRAVQIGASGIFSATTGCTIVAAFTGTGVLVANNAAAGVWNTNFNDTAQIDTSATAFRSLIRSNSANQALYTNTADAGVIHCAALSWATNNADYAFDEVAATNDSTVTEPTSPFTAVYCGSSCHKVREVIAIDAKLTADELVKITGDYRR